MTFADFDERIYLPRHENRACRLLHLAGTLLSVATLAAVLSLGVALSASAWWLLLLVPAPAYLLAWLGHGMASNRPTAFDYP